MLGLDVLCCFKKGISLGTNALSNERMEISKASSGQSVTVCYSHVPM